LCILISSSIKSAQFLGHLWLPDSMEAPVPASSLIHSATLVSAGIYLLLKFQIIFSITGLFKFIFLLGSFTACYGGIIAASQSDMKKLLAYSTISHCGFIVASISLNNFLVTVVYLYLHGLFKALTFFCAGSIIKFNGTQDTRLMGMNKNQLINIITLTVASINLGGLPFTFGYLYKYLFINFLIINPINMVGYGFNIVGMLCSVVYVYKLIYYSCFDYRKGPYQLLSNLIQNNKN
jgi:NADH-ubiquinone oxidoreductase chain 5